MTEKFERQSWKLQLDRRSYLKAATGVAGVAALGSVASASESDHVDGDESSASPEVDSFYETFDDLSAFSGDVSAFEIVTGDGGR